MSRQGRKPAEPIQQVAIVGIGCRLGGAVGPAGFWRLLCSGLEAVREIPAERFRQLGVERDPQPGTPGKVVTRRGAFLERVDLFDAGFFGISPAEAACMDPQHRLLLEVAWEAVEDAGLTTERMAHSRAGTYVGLWSGDYEHYLFNLTRRQDLYMAIGGGRASAAGRVSFALDLRGPSLTVDTGCSSSLVAVHLACQGLRAGETELALAGGVNLILDPSVTLAYSRAGMLSPDGRCKFGDARANGYVRSEGCGVVALKLLSKAIEDGDRIYALIVGDAVNNDGRQGFFVTPSQAGQEALLRAAYRQAGVVPAEVCFVEAHGTGTAVGDPVETGALGAVLGEGRPVDRPCLIGSVKTQIGHMEAAAGVAGLIKAALSVHHRALPASLHYETPNPNIPWSRLPLVVQTAMGRLPEWSKPVLAGVNSFGITGTNAHVILQEPDRSESPSQPEATGPWVLPLSARSPEALEALRESWVGFLGAEAGSLAPGEGLPRIDQLCYTAAVRRVHHDHRLAVTGCGREDLLDRLRASVVEGLGAVRENGAGVRVVFVFSGQGPQWWAMGRQLYGREAIYRNVIDECSQLLRPLTGWSLVDELMAGEARSRMEDTEVAQPALFALQVALAAVWKHRGVSPDGLIGHSVGEVAAAVVSGGLTLAQGLRVVAHRGRVMQRATGQGRMAALGVGPEQAQKLIAPWQGRVCVAAVNSPVSVTLAGPGELLEGIVKEAEQNGLFARLLKVNYAFHSPTLDPYQPQLAAMLADLQAGSPQIPVWSSVTGAAAGAGTFDGAHWTRGIRQPVCFAQAVSGAIEADDKRVVFLELGPHPVLAASLRECLKASSKEGLWLASLRRDSDDSETMLAALASLYAAGRNVRWEALFTGAVEPVSLPTYPWQRERLWVDPAPEATRIRPTSASGQDAIWTHRTRSGGGSSAYLAEGTWTARQPPGVQDHRVQGTILAPAAGFAALVLAEATSAFGPGRHALRGVRFCDALPLGSEPRKVRLSLDPVEPGLVRFQFASQPETTPGAESEWVVHVEGMVELAPDDNQAPVPLPETVPQALEWTSQGDASSFYQELLLRGLDYGQVFRPVVEWRRGGGRGWARLRPSDRLSWAGEDSLPVDVLDACLQLAVSLCPLGAGTWVPTGCERLEAEPALATAAEVVIEAVLNAGEVEGTLRGSTCVRGSDGAVLAVLSGVALGRIEGIGGRNVAEWFHEIDWVLAARPPAAIPGTPEFLPSQQDLARGLEQARAKALAATAFDPALARRLDGVSASFIVRALRQLGWPLEAGTSRIRTQLAGALGVAATHHRLLDRLLEILVEDGVLAPDGDLWRVKRVEPEDPIAAGQALQEAHPGCAVELALFLRCAEHLAEVLAGRRDPLQLLFPQGSLDSAEQLYRDTPFSRVCNEMVRETVRTAVAALPPDRRLRVLEIGAGTGGTTSHVLPLLPPDRTQYVFTDVSTLFTSKAADRFRQYGFVEYRLLDINRDPAAQDFESGSFDIILAANVLHATPEMQRTLSHTRDLLAPGGLLLLVEGTERSRWVDLVFGLIEGWWLFADRELRPAHPLLSAAKWEQLLAGTGFESAVMLPNATVPRGAIFEQVIIGACRPANEDIPARRWLVFEDEQGVASPLCAALAKRGVQTLRVRRGSEWISRNGEWSIPPELAPSLSRVLQEIDTQGGPPLEGIAYLWPLDAVVDSDEAGARRLTCDGLLALTQAVVAASGAGLPAWRRTRLWIVTKGAQPAGAKAVTHPLAAPAWGLGRVIGLEHPALRCSLLDLDADHFAAEEVASELLAGTGSAQVCLRGSGRFEARLAKTGGSPATGGARQARPRHHAYRLVSQKPGTLDGLTYQQLRRRAPGPGEVEIAVQASGLNFRDVIIALGLLPDYASELGLDAAGIVSAVGPGVTEFRAGDAVMAFAVGAFGSHVTARKECVLRWPAGFSAEQAAGVPVVFLTAYHALNTLARITAQDTVLIHAAAGGVGLAAVQLARLAGSRIMGTAGTAAKREMLRAMGVRHVFDSRSPGFADEVLRVTDGEGVDVVLNSLAGPFITRSFEVLRPEGRFIEIGKSGVWTPEQARQVRPRAFYEVFDLTELGRRDPARIQEMLRTLLSDFEAKRLQPLPIQVHPAESIGEAFRLMSQGHHVGKIVISQAASSADGGGIRFRQDAACLITGGFGGLGLRMAEWMASRGLRHVALMGRRGPDAAGSERVAALRHNGVNVLCVPGDVAQEADVRAALEQIAQAMPPLRYVLHSAGSLDDGVLVQQTPERFRRVLAPKIAGGMHLDRLTRHLPIEHFVLFSSWASVWGSPGQANHSAANAFLDALAHRRRREGLPALSINWGPWTEIGAAASYADRLGARGVGCFSPAEGLRAFEALLASDREQVAVVPFDAEHWRAASPESGHRWLEALVKVTPTLPSAGTGPATQPRREDIRDALATAATERDRTRTLESWLREQVASVLRIPVGRIDPAKPLKTLGFDSLLSVEFRNRLEASLGLQLPATVIWNYPTVGALTTYLLSRMALAAPSAGASPAFVPAPVSAVRPEASPSLPKPVEDLSEEEAMEQLNRRLTRLEGRD